MPEHEVSETMGVKNMRIIRRHGLWLSTSLIVGIALAISVAASAKGETTGASSPDTGKAASAMSALRRARAAADSIPASSRGFVKTQRPVNVAESLFEGAWQLGGSRRLLAGAGASRANVFAVPTDRGHVCSIIFVPPVAAAGGCVDDFNTVTPVGWTAFDPDGVDTGSAVIVGGVAPDDVASVGVVVNGATFAAKLARNAFLYQPLDNASYPSAIVVTYANGTSRTVEIQDPRVAMRACASGTC
jgi:hypothetical protein